MVNVFGVRGVGSIGTQGPPGHAGPPVSPGTKSGFDAFCNWLPNLALDGFRIEEVGYFLLTVPNTDVKREGK